jgi:hypothetical protein
MQVLHSLCSLHSRDISDRAGASALARMRAAMMIFSDAYGLILPTSPSAPAELLPLSSFLNRALVRIKAAHFGAITLPKIDLILPDAPIPMQLITAWALLLNELVAEIILLNGDCADAELVVSGTVNGPSVVLTIKNEHSLPIDDKTPDEPSNSSEASLLNFKHFGPVGPALIRQTSAVVALTSGKTPQLRVELPITA